MRALQQLIGCPMPPWQTMEERIKESIKLDAPFQHFATVIISQGDIIKGISQSKRNNLIVDNFGVLLAGLFKTQTTTKTEVTLQDEGDTGRTVCTYGTWAASARNFNNYTTSSGTKLKMGSGVTAATRGDYDIETDLPTSPEDDFFGSGTGSYAGGAVSIGAALTAGGNGTINEVGLFGYWHDNNTSVYNFMLLHDILTSGEAYVIGNTLTVAYTINL